MYILYSNNWYNKIKITFHQEKCSGQLTFEDVHFTYDSRPDVPVLRGLNLSIPAGHKVALVGQSGSGKSTIVSLVERFYECKLGRVVRLPMLS